MNPHCQVPVVSKAHQEKHMGTSFKMNFHWKILVFGILICVSLSKGHEGKEKSSQDVPARIVKGIGNLGRKLLAYLESASAPNENVLISPVNIFHAVALLHKAADGNTQKELSNIMGIPPNSNYSKSLIHSVLSSFYKNITTSDKDPVILNVADAFFLQDGFPIKKDYQDYVVKYYDANVENINFRAGKVAVDKINNWVSEKTRGRITGVVDENLNPDTMAMIISTLYFNAKWASAFYELNTKNDTFFNGEKNVDVQMMSSVQRLPYVNNKELQFEAIDLHYDGYETTYALNIILPYEGQTIKNLIPKLADLSINQIMEKSETVGVNLKMPKLKFNWRSSLVKTLQQLGVQEMFAVANFKDLTDAIFKISEIVHGTEIEINEKGTIATAVTVAHIVAASLPPPIINPVPFYVNRPFIANIYSPRTGLCLFSGIVYKPDASS